MVASNEVSWGIAIVQSRPMSRLSTEPAPTVEPAPAEARRLRELSPAQWKSGLAAWLGWLFDGLDMHLYTLVAAPFVMELLAAASPADPVGAREELVDPGRVPRGLGARRRLLRPPRRPPRPQPRPEPHHPHLRACSPGCRSSPRAWWHLMIFRFLAALGIGGEWAVGSSLLSETWPTALAALDRGRAPGRRQHRHPDRLPGRLPARRPSRRAASSSWASCPRSSCFWIRRNVPEPAEWQAARANGRRASPGSRRSLPRRRPRHHGEDDPGLRAARSSAWWAFQFWHPQHLRNLPELAGWARPDRERLVTKAFFLVIAVSIVGNFAAGWPGPLARLPARDRRS